MSQRNIPFDRTITLGLVVTVMLQTAGALIWAGATEARLNTLETQMALTPAVAERLARLEGQSLVMAQSLSRIERRLMQADP
jgi:hypothetical protein